MGRAKKDPQDDDEEEDASRWGKKASKRRGGWLVYKGDGRGSNSATQRWRVRFSGVINPLCARP